MANYSEPFQAVLDNVYPKIQYTAYHDKEAVYLMWLNNHCKVPFTSAGEYFRLPIQYGHTDDSTDIAASPYGVISTTALTDQDALKFKCSGFVLPIVGSNWEIEVLVGNDKNRSYDYWLSKTETRAKAAQKVLGARLFGNGGSTATDTVGLGYMVDQSDTSYGGLTRSSANADGQWPQEDTTTTSITWRAMTNLLMSCRAATDLIVTTKSIFGYLLAMRQSQEVYEPIPAGKEFAAVGAPYIAFNQIPIVWDENCTAAAIYFLASKHIKYFAHSQWNLQAEKVVDKTVDQEVRVGRITWAGQHVSNNCQYLGRFDAVTS